AAKSSQNAANEKRDDLITVGALAADKRDDKATMTDAIRDLNDLARATTVLKALEPDQAAPTNLATAKDRLQRQVRAARKPEQVDKIFAAFKSAQLVQ